MTIPVAPQEMSPTDPKRIGGVWSFISRFNDLIAWIKSLSPSGATVYDTGWITLTPTGGLTGSARVRRVGKVAFLWYDLNGTASADSVILNLPAGFEATGLVAASEYQYGITNLVRGAYHNGAAAQIRIPGQPSVTRRFGTMTWPLA